MPHPLTQNNQIRHRNTYGVGHPDRKLTGTAARRMRSELCERLRQPAVCRTFARQAARRTRCLRHSMSASGLRLRKSSICGWWLLQTVRRVLRNATWKIVETITEMPVSL